MSPRRVIAGIVVSVLLIGGTVFAGATLARSSAARQARQQEAAAAMQSAMLNEETGVRGYFETRSAVFLQPYILGTSQFRRALSESRSLAGSDRALVSALNGMAQIASSWRAATRAQITRLRTTRVAPNIGQALADKATMDSFRAANSAFGAQLNQRRNSNMSSQTWWAVGLSAALALIFAFAGLVVVSRATRRETTRLRRQRELRDLLQASESEDESRTLLIRHVERLLPGARAAMFNRNSSGDRLEPVVLEGDRDTVLRDLVTEQIAPRSCMAVRLSRPHERRVGDEPLLSCEVCGKVGANIACEPLLVGGQVIGSVLVAREERITEQELDRVRDTVTQATPILANQRTLAIAELRAASDALTGLPNRRAADDTLIRMAAQASRRASSLAAVLLDLDHFKTINDVHGHDAGDKALAAVAQILSSTLRASDFAARYGGEEFLLLLPDTDRESAVSVAEKIRRAIEVADISDAGTVTASFGVAAIPENAGDTGQLIRQADRALYVAKAEGRNQVRAADVRVLARGEGD